MVIGAEHVDRTVETSGKLVEHIRNVRGVVQIGAVRGAHERPVLVVPVLRRGRPERSLGFVRVDPLERLRDLGCDFGLPNPCVHGYPESRELGSDRVHHQQHGVALALRDLLDVVPSITILGRLLATPARFDGLAEELDLTTDVVVVVLALDIVSGEL